MCSSDLLINAGVSRVVMTDKKTNMDPELARIALTMFLEAGVDVKFFEDKGEQE